MMFWYSVLLLLACVLSETVADIYLHVPRGSNNRLNGKSATRTNADRLFDSQNNNRGGYNVGDKTQSESGQNEDNQYRMSYFQSGSRSRVLSDGAGSSYLTVEWTNQHGCGGNDATDPHKQNCNIVLQYMCHDDKKEGGVSETMRNGVQVETQPYTPPASLDESHSDMLTRQQQVNDKLGLHEAWNWYDKCHVRDRNKGLFTADQQLQGRNGLGYSSAIYTRQNARGKRRGYECPEDAHYYPYWHPTPWRDIAVLAENSSICSHYQSKSFNVHAYHECVEYWDVAKTQRKHYSRWNNLHDCEINGGKWTALHNYLEKATDLTSRETCKSASKDGLQYIWAVPYDSTDGITEQCLVALEAPSCTQAPWSRSNHLGNGRFGEANNLTWTLPYFPSGKAQRCVLRVRYNVSSDDYDPYHMDYRQNGARSPISQNPVVDVGSGVHLQLAVDTADFGHMFQDRTHVFLLTPRPPGLDDYRIYNLNVRGKRGNIVQVFGAVEYDFFPNPLYITPDDLVHIQWTGSNSHNNEAQAGDGQQGNDGQGTAGTDRNNMVQIADLNENFPLPFESSTMWKNADVKWIYHGKTDIKAQDLAISLASSGYFSCVKKIDCPELDGETTDTKQAMHNELNNAPASYHGVLLKFKRGKYHYMCTRNNSYTNRSQKGTISVS